MQQNKNILLSDSVDLDFITPLDQSFKFGYYNYCPLSNDNKYLLAHKIPFEGRPPEASDQVEVGYFDIANRKWHKLADSKAFNWQQGSMLQWLGNSKNKNVIFNDAKHNKYISRIIDINNGQENELPHAIYGLTPDGKTSISINFERCNFTRAYSYASVVDETWNENLPEKDGIVSIDIETGKTKTILKLKDLLKDYPIPGNYRHWLEHIMINPSGTKFAFYHRYGSDIGFKTRCFIADIDGANLRLHPNKGSERLSHLGWVDDENYVLYTIPQSKANQAIVGKVNATGKDKKVKTYVKLYRKLLKPFVPRALVKSLPKPSKYYAYTNIENGIKSRINPWPYNMDGHPSFTKNKRYMLTDTYADKSGYRHLVIHDLKKDKTISIGKFKSVYNNCGWRADLHPRFSYDETKVIIDSNHNGHTQMLVLSLKDDLLKLK